jgi:hypothetical protein
MNSTPVPDAEQAPPPLDPADPVLRQLSEATELARDAAEEDALPGEVGDHVGVELEDEAAVTHLFDSRTPGYRGWCWAVTVSSAGLDTEVTVSEVVMLPGPDALTAPEWVPWQQRVQAGDLGVGDLMPTAPDDPRLVPGYLASGDPVIDDTSLEIGLGRPRVMSRSARLDAAARWRSGEFGPRSDMARGAPGPCATCGFYLPIAGALSAAFGVCGNEIAPADGHLVHAEYGCGAHSEAEVEQVSPVLVADLIYDDDAMLDIELIDRAPTAPPHPTAAEPTTPPPTALDTPPTAPSAPVPAALDTLPAAPEAPSLPVPAALDTPPAAPEALAPQSVEPPQAPATPEPSEALVSHPAEPPTAPEPEALVPQPAEAPTPAEPAALDPALVAPEAPGLPAPPAEPEPTAPEALAPQSTEPPQAPATLEPEAPAEALASYSAEPPTAPEAQVPADALASQAAELTTQAPEAPASQPAEAPITLEAPTPAEPEALDPALAVPEAPSLPAPPAESEPAAPVALAPQPVETPTTTPEAPAPVEPEALEPAADVQPGPAFRPWLAWSRPADEPDAE